MQTTRNFNPKIWHHFLPSSFNPVQKCVILALQITLPNIFCDWYSCLFHLQILLLQSYLYANDLFLQLYLLVHLLTKLKTASKVACRVVYKDYSKCWVCFKLLHLSKALWSQLHSNYIIHMFCFKHDFTQIVNTKPFLYCLY